MDKCRMNFARFTIVVVLFSIACFLGEVDSACTWTQPDYKWWSVPSSWPSNTVPANGTDVVIPTGYKIVYDISTVGVIFNSITVSSGAQLLVDQTKNINLATSYILVQPGATFNVGNSTCPYTYKATITLYGLRASNVSANGYGNKGIIVGGNVEFWGAPPQPTWTSVAATVMPSATSFTVRDNLSNWKVGDTIVLATTDYYAELSEVFQIVAVVGRNITVNRPIQYMHYGANNQYAEVGSLTRNIVIQGDNVTSDSEQYGGHVLLYGNATGKVWGVEFLRMGQRNKIGRYPFHFHVMGNQVGKGHFVSENSFHDNYQRCFTIHGTSGILVRNNVGWNVTGHCYFLEEGSETMNYYDHNLGILANAGQLIPTDASASIFWITNPNNTYVNNVAVGGFHGFWFSLPVTPLGLTANWTQFRPRNTVMGPFLNNIAHSNQNNGVYNDDGPDSTGNVGETLYNPCVDPLASTLVPVRVTYTNITSYKNRAYGFWIRGNPITVDSCLFMDNGIGVNTPYNGNIVSNSVIVGETDNIGTPSFTPFFYDLGRSRPVLWNLGSQIKGVEFYDTNGNQYSVNNTFINLTTNSVRAAGAIGVQTGYYILPSNVLVVQSKLVNSSVFVANYNVSVTYDGPMRVIVQDNDGSLTGTYGNFIVAPNNMLTYDNLCTLRPEYNGFYLCPRTDNGYVNIYLTNSNVGGTNFNGSSASVTFTPFGQPAISDTVMGSNSRTPTRSNYGTNVRSKQGYVVSFPFPTPPQLVFSLQSAYQGEWVMIALSYPRTANLTVSRTGYNTPMTVASSVSAITASSYFYDPIQQFLYVMYREETPAANAAGFPESFWGTWGIQIGATCGMNCVVPGVRPVPAALASEDKYRATMRGCSNTNNYEGSAYISYNTLTKRLSYVIYHNLTDAIGATIQDLNTGLIFDLAIPYPPIKGGFDMSLIKFNQLWNGNWSVVITSANPKNSIRGVIGCAGTCSSPPLVSTTAPCTTFPGQMTIFNDSLNTGSGWTDWSYGYNRSLNYTADKCCGASSIQIIYSSYDELNFHVGDCAPGTCTQSWQHPAINVSSYAYLQFNAKNPSGVALPFPLTITSPYGSAPLVSKYIDNWTLDNIWTRVKVPLTDIGFKGTELIWGNLGIGMLGNLYPPTATVTMLFDDIKLVPAYTDLTGPPVGTVKYFTGPQC